MNKIEYPNDEWLPRNQAERLLLTQTIESTGEHQLSLDELRWELAVQKIMLQILQQKLSEPNNGNTLSHSGQEIATAKQNSAPTTKPGIANTTVLANIQDAYMELDENFCYTYVNHSIERFTNHSQDYWIGKQLKDEFPYGDPISITQAVIKAADEKKFTIIEAFYSPTGLWYEAQIYPMGEIVSIFIRDITVCKKADIDLQETCEMGKIGGWEGYLANNQLFLSKESCQILGIEQNSTLTFKQALGFFDIAGGHPGNLEIHQNIREAVLKGHGFDEEIKIKLSNGREKWLRIKGRTEFASQKPARLRGILQDITKVKEAQEKLYENEKRFRLFMNNSPLAAWIVNADGFFDYVNKQYYSLFNPGGIVIGKNISDVYPKKLASLYTEENKQLLLQKHTLVDLKHTIINDGEEQHFLVNKFLLDEKGSKPKIGGIAVDVTEQVKINEKLVNQQRFLKGITDNAPGLMSYWTSNLICTFTNQTAKEWLGTELKDIVGHNMKDVLGEELFDHNYPYIQRALQGEKVQFERGGFNIHGVPGFIWIQYVPDIHGGEVKGFYSLVTDITELKKTQLAIEFEERDKEALINSSNDFIASLDRNLRIVTANKAYRHLFESITGVPVRKGDSVKTGSGFDEATWALWDGFFKRALAGESFTEETVTRPAGTDVEIWTECSFNPIVQDGQITGLACYSRNITERKKAQETIRNSEAKFKALLQNISDIITLVDETGKIKYVSPSVTTVMGYEENDVLERNIFELIHPDDYSPAFAEMQKALRQPSYNTTFEVRLLHKNGHYVYLEVRGTNQLSNPLIRALLVNCRDITERKTADRAIAESYKKLEDYKFAVDQSNTVFIMDDAGTYLYVNDNFCKLTKYTRDEVVGQNRLKLASGYHSESFFEAMWATIRSGKVWRSQVKGKAKDGTYFWVEATITPFLDSTGKPYQYLSINSDITQTKMGEEALAISNERFRYVTRATFDAIWDWDIVNKTIFWGDGYKTLFGYEPGTHSITPNSGFSINIHPDERKKVLTSIYDTIDSGAFYWSYGYRYRKIDGEYAYVVDKAIIIRDEQGHAIRMIGAMQDNTQRRVAIEELKKSELKFRSMVYNINDVITLVDENGIVLYCSPSLKTVLGYDPEEVVGLKMFSLLHPDDYGLSKDIFKYLLATEGNGGVIEFRYSHKNGHYITMESQGNNQLNNPAINAVILTTRDITKRKEKEEEKLQLVYELMEKNADLKQFSYITSHNLRAPLTNLIAICTLLDTENVSKEDTHELINAFRTSTVKLNDTLNDLISLLIIKDGKSQEIETVYFDKTITEVKASLAGMIEASGAVIHADFSAAVSVNFYSTYMESIFLNLLTNSIKYAHPGRRPVIAMQTRDEEKFVVLTFMDNGMGMNMQKVKSKIFGLYQRFHSNIEGKGIGLYLVQSQVTTLGGSITVDSKEDEGTTFVIWFKKDLFGRR